MELTNNNEISINFLKMPVFSSLSDIDKKVLTAKCDLKLFEAGSTIIEQGDNTTTVYFLISGTVHVVDYSSAARAMTYASLKEGDMFGEMAIIEGLPRSAWVCTITPCKLASLPGALFLEMVKKNADVSLALLKQFSLRLRLSNSRLKDVSLLGTEQRACMELIRMAKVDPQSPGSYLIFQMPTQANFANIIGSSRETVSRIFGKLKEEHIIIISKRGLCIPNRERLERRAFL
jgi:CRP/FNR family cyclic AMP-dependent transcriptional regulator|tara:strand:- start:252 stop:950 length:699 start_codon:yes stop_codon:yes gene_type:complete